MQALLSFLISASEVVTYAWLAGFGGKIRIARFPSVYRDKYSKEFVKNQVVMKSLLEVAISQLGVEEEPKGSNSGPMVDQYLRSVGLGKGLSWCMSFVYWCSIYAASAQNKTTPLYRTGGVLDQWYKSKALRVVGPPKPGDIFIMDFGAGLGHTGIVKNVGPTRIDTIEGNATLATGSREGVAVVQKNRLQAAMLGYLRTGL